MELLVVMAIVVALAALTAGGFKVVKEKQRREQARVQVNLIQMSLESYATDHGEYPPNPEQNAKNGTDEIFNALFGDPLQEGTNIYLAELDPENDTQDWLQGQNGTQNLTIYDPWGTEFFYRTNDPENPDQVIAANPDFDLWSAGPDGKTDAGAAGSYDSQSPDNQDDIRGWD